MSNELRSPALSRLAEQIQSEALPGIWSRGVSLARENRVLLRDASKIDEIRFQVTAPGQIAAANVQLWPDDEDSFCDCKSAQIPCMHLCAVASAIRSGSILAEPSQTATPSASAGLFYQLSAEGRALSILRYLSRDRSRAISEEIETSSFYKDSLLSLAAKGSAPFVYDQDDLAIDRFLSAGQLNLCSLNREARLLLFKRLKSVADQGRITFREKPLSISIDAYIDQYVIRDENGGFRLKLESAKSNLEALAPGYILIDGATLALDDRQTLDAKERRTLEIDGRFYRALEIGKLSETIIPELRKRARVRIEAKRLLEAEPHAAKLAFSIRALSHSRFEVTPEIVAATSTEVQALTQKLRNDFQLAPLSPRVFENDDAVRFAEHLSARSATDSDLLLQGESLSSYLDLGELKPLMQVIDGRLQFEFSIESSRVAAADILTRYRTGSNYIALGDRPGFARLPKEWLNSFSEIVERWLNARETNQTPLTPQAAYLDALKILVDSNVSLAPSPEFEAFYRAIQSHSNLPAPTLPLALTATLRPYQQEGVAWMQFLMRYGFGVLLADDMGLGKTLQALALIRGRTLIICPTSVIHAWKEQCARFRPDLNISAYWGADRKLDPNATVTLTTYGTLRQDAERLAAESFELVILDEAHAIKNIDRKTSQAALALRAQSRLALTGTPIENHADELRNLFRFLMPSWGDDSMSTEELRAKVKPLILRRLKRDVAKDLPPRTEVVLEVDLNETEMKIYRSIEAAASMTSSVSVLESLLRLRQVACHTGLVPGFESNEHSTKVEFLADRLSEAVEGGHASLVFSQWTSLLDRIERALKTRGLSWLRLDGSLSTDERARIVSEFQNESGPPILLMSLKAGGVGLTLTRADQVYICDPWWNPAAEAQAADRAHRIGQTRPVLISKIVARNTVEDRMLALQQAKLSLADSFLEARNLEQAFTLDELKSLIR